MVPLIELRGAIPVSQGLGLPIIPSYIVCILANMVPCLLYTSEGSFMQGSVIDVLSFKGQLIARGITNYSSDELKLIKDHHSNEIESILHYKDYDEVIHADNLVINKGVKL